MTAAVAVYCVAGALTTLVVLRWALLDYPGVLLTTTAAILWGLLWPLAGVIYLWTEAP